MTFASEADRQKLREAPLGLEAMNDHILNRAAGGWIGFLEGANVGLAASGQRREIVDDLKDELLTDLYNGQLTAVGYREHPSKSTAPVVIDPAHFADGNANWNESKYDANGLRWNRVRIADPADNPVRKKPSSADAIRDAITRLRENDQDFCGKARKIQAQLVRQQIGVIYSPSNGLSDGNIAKLIVDICGTRAISK